MAEYTVINPSIHATIEGFFIFRSFNVALSLPFQKGLFMSSMKKTKNITVEDCQHFAGNRKLVFVSISYASSPDQEFCGFSLKREDGDYSMLTASNLSIKVQFTPAILGRGLVAISTVVNAVEDISIIKSNQLTESDFERCGIKITRPGNQKGEARTPWVDINEAWQLLFVPPASAPSVYFDGREITIENAESKKNFKIFSENSKIKAHDKSDIFVPYKEEDPVVFDDETAVVDEPTLYSDDEPTNVEESEDQYVWGEGLTFDNEDEIFEVEEPDFIEDSIVEELDKAFANATTPLVDPYESK